MLTAHRSDQHGGNIRLKTRGAPGILANISAWVMQELEHGREIDEIAADVRMNQHQLTALVMMSGLIGLNAPRSLLRCSDVAQR